MRYKKKTEEKSGREVNGLKKKVGERKRNVTEGMARKSRNGTQRPQKIIKEPNSP